ncbi:hypothetical protein UlMin_044621 [Ulmus minor]
MDMTIRVLNLSPTLTLDDLHSFFSYCGTVEKIQMKKDEKGSQQFALVTFRQPYAFQTALLLHNAILGERPLCILRAGEIEVPIVSDDENGSEAQQLQKKNKEGLVAVSGRMEEMVSKYGVEMAKRMNELEDRYGAKRMNELEDRYKLWEKGKKLGRTTLQLG